MSAFDPIASIFDIAALEKEAEEVGKLIKDAITEGKKVATVISSAAEKGTPKGTKETIDGLNELSLTTSNYTKILAILSANIDKLNAEQKKRLLNLNEQYRAEEAQRQSAKETVKLQQLEISQAARLAAGQSELAKAIAINNQQLKSEKMERDRLAKVLNAENGSREKAQALIDLLINKGKKLDLTTEQGRRKNEAYNRVIEKQLEFLKKYNDAESNRIKNIGNYNASANIIVEALERERKKLNELEAARVRVQNAGATFTPGNVAANKTTILGFAGGSGNSSPAFDRIATQAQSADQAVEMLNEEIQRSRVVVEGFQRVTGQPLFLKAAGGLADANKELAFFRKALIDLERAGLGDSDAANLLKKQLAELQDQIADTKDELKALASDTRGFDQFAGAVSFVADAFQTAAGAAVLFGASEEDAAKATATLVAIQSVSNGLKGIATELTTKGTAANRVYAAVQVLVATATDSTAKATARLAAAGKLLLGLGLIAFVGFIIAKIVKLREVITDAARQTKLLAELNTELARNAGQSIAKLEILYKVATDVNSSVKERKKAVDQLQEQYPEYFKNLSDEIIMQGNAAGAYDRTKLAILEVARTRAVETKLTELFTKQLDLQYQKEALLEKQRLNDAKQRAADALSRNNKDEQETRGLEQANAIGEGSRIKKELFDLGNDLGNITKDINFLLGQIGTIDPVKAEKSKKEAKEKQERLRKDLNVEFETYKLAQERLISLYKDGLAQETQLDEASYLDKRRITGERIALLALAFKEENNLLDAQQRNQIERLKKQAEIEGKGKAKAERIIIAQETADQIKLIEQNSYNARILLYRQYIKDYDKLLSDFENAREKAEDDSAKRLQDRLEKGLAKRTTLSIDIDGYNDAQKKLSELKAKIKELRTEIAATFLNTASDFLGNYFDAQKNGLDLLIRKNNELKDAEVGRISQLAISEQEKADKIAIIEAQTEAKNNAIEKRKSELEVRKAKFEKAIAVGKILLDTIIAVNKVKAEAAALLANPVTAALAPFALAQIPYLLFSQGLALAAVATRPIPKFFRGLFHDYSGPGIMDDGGKKEALIRADGTIDIAPGPAQERLVQINPGDRILPDASVLFDSLKYMAFMQTKQAAGLALPMDWPGFSGLEDKMDKQTGRIVSAINNQPRSVTTASESGMRKLWLWGANETRYIQENTNW